MTHSIFTIRPAMTAIAAVLASSSAPLLAQVVEPVTETPAPAASDPLAPEPAAETPAAAEPAAAAPARTTRARATTPRTTRAQAAPRASAPRSAAAAPAAAVTPAPTAEPIATPPVPAEPVVAETPAPAIAAPAEQPSPVDTFLASDEALPVAGAAGLGILALGGAGLVARRRRRRREAEAAEWQDYAEATPAAVAAPGHIPEPQRATMEPTFVRAFADAPAAAPAIAPAMAPAAAVAGSDEVEGPTTDLPEGFDLSRFGPHVQAAYKGPTEDNPSLSLKYRLRRAAALDQMARKAGTAPVAARPAQSSAPRPAADQANGEFLLRRAATRPNMKPAFSE